MQRPPFHPRPEMLPDSAVIWGLSSAVCTFLLKGQGRCLGDMEVVCFVLRPAPLYSFEESGPRGGGQRAPGASAGWTLIRTER